MSTQVSINILVNKAGIASQDVEWIAAFNAKSLSQGERHPIDLNQDATSVSEVVGIPEHYPCG